MTHKLGMHWLRYHQDGRDLEHIERMQYCSIKPFQWMWNNRDFCRDLLTVLPGDSYILARDHPLSEQKEDMWRDPVGTGVRHANEWAEKVRNGQYHLPTDRTFFLGINEPDATDGDRNAIDVYTVSYLDRLRAHGLRGGAFGFSTGHPRTVDGTADTKADYTVFERSHQAILRGGHIAIAHIYGTAAVPLAPGHFDRLAACPWQDVEWVIGEFGIDEYVVGGGEHAGFHKGFEGRLHEYCGWIDRAIMGIEAIFPYIHDYELYTYDFSHPWDSFNVRDIREALESYDWQHAKRGNVPPQSGPVVINLPSIQNGKPTAIVDAPAGANIRSGPGTDYPVLGTDVYGQAMPVVGKSAAGDWWAVQSQFGKGWVHGMIVRTLNVGSVPTMVSVAPVQDAPVQATGIIDPITTLAFLDVESGNVAFVNGLLTIRFEVHMFKKHLGNDELFNRHFRFVPDDYGAQYFRPDEQSEWKNVHGSMALRHEVLRFARRLNDTAALLSTGMGMAQIMGSNHARIGYATPQAMFNAFSNHEYGVNAQIMGFVDFILSDPGLLDALQKRNWWTAVQKYNGTGQEQLYVNKLEAALEKIQREIGA